MSGDNLLWLLIVRAILDWLTSRPAEGGISKEQLDKVDTEWKNVMSKWKGELNG